MGPATASPSSEEVREQLDRMLGHPLFAQSERMKRFLTFAVEKALAGREDELKEYAVALDVYDKDESFDPRTDPIVRVEAGRLRDRIDNYYNENPTDPILIRLRKRGYRPIIRWSGKKRPGDRGGTPKTSEPSGTRPAPAPCRLVVLPLRDLSRDQSQEYFCEAITEQIAGILSRLPNVQVAAHTTARQFSGTAVDVRRIARELSVNLLLEGSVQRSGRYLRVNARLCRADDGLQVWSHTCDRELKDILALQDDVAETVTSNVVHMLSASRDVRAPDGARATRLLNLARARQQREHEAELDRTIAAFRTATAEPGCPAGAWSGLAESIVNRLVHGTADVRQMTQSAMKAARQAVGIDPASSSAHAAQGAIHVLAERNWAEAEAAFGEALRLEPQNPLAHHWYGHFCLAPRGRLVDARTELEMSVDLNATNLWANSDLAFLEYLMGHNDRAIDQARYVREIEPRCRAAGWILGRCHAVSGDYDRSLEMLEWTADLRRDRQWTATRGYCYARMGRTDDARELIAELRSNARRTAYAIAEIYLGLGERERALRWLHRAVEERVPLSIWVAVDPLFESLGRLTGFRDIVRTLGLEAQDRGKLTLSASGTPRHKRAN